MNINDDNNGKCYGVPTDFIGKLTNLFFIIIGEKSSTSMPLRKMYQFLKSATLTYLYGLMYLQLDDYPPYYDKNQTFLRHTLTGTWYVLMDIPIMLHIIIWLLSEFSQAEKIISCHGTNICNHYEQMNMSGDILNSGGNAEYE